MIKQNIKDGKVVRARLLRKMTLAEKVAADLIRDNFPEVEFREQAVIRVPIAVGSPFHERKKYFVDIFFPHYGLVVEIDGGVHNNTTQHDTKRDLLLMKRFLVCRVPNSIVLHAPLTFLSIIRQSLANRASIKQVCLPWTHAETCRAI